MDGATSIKNNNNLLKVIYLNINHETILITIYLLALKFNQFQHLMIILWVSFETKYFFSVKTKMTH